MGFGKDFLWGAATAAAQIEGGFDRDGRGLSIWDDIRPEEGRSLNGSDARITCEHYTHWKEDVAHMKEIGLKSYRFSISWTRLYPQGYGAFNPKGAEFYSDLIDELIAAGIKPMITVYHWDMPAAVYARGGWLNPDCEQWFAAFAAKVAELYSDRVGTFILLNEPECIVDGGYNLGSLAPFEKLPFDKVLCVMHRLLLAHGAAVRAMRKAAKRPIKIGMAVVSGAYIPATESEADIEAARRLTFYKTGKTLFKSIAFFETAQTGRYPACIEDEFGSWFSHPASEMERIAAPLDFFACNVYQAKRVKAGADGTPERMLFPYNTCYTAKQWPITPECVYWAARFFYERYGLPIYITENGIATVDLPDDDGAVEDPSRILYVKQHLRYAQRAVNEGIPLQGYYYWSLLDNYEWRMGFSQRFGLIYVDYETQKRTLKKSALWYRDVIRSNGENL